jgi:hypothetical protein
MAFACSSCYASIAAYPCHRCGCRDTGDGPRPIAQKPDPLVWAPVPSDERYEDDEDDFENGLDDDLDGDLEDDEADALGCDDELDDDDLDGRGPEHFEALTDEDIADDLYS